MYSAISITSKFTQYLSKLRFSNILLPTKTIPSLFQKKKIIEIRQDLSIH